MKPISNALAKTISSLHTQHMRDKAGLFLIEGKKCLEEAVKHQIDIKQIVLSNSFWKDNQLPDNIASDEIYISDDKQFEQLVTTDSSCGILATAKTPSADNQSLFKSEKTPFIVVAESVQDPGNIGTIIRTAAATSATGIILTKGCTNPYNPKVVRSAMGTLFGLPIVFDINSAETIELLKQKQVKIMVTDANAKISYLKADFSGPIALVFGSEGQGISKSMLESANEKVSIPMNSQVESLNVAVSAGILLYAAYQQRNHLNSQGV